MSGAWRALTSRRTTVVLLCALALLLLLNTVVPQEALLGDDAIRRMVEGRPVAGFLLITLGLARMPTSPVFLAALGLFFANLVAVLIRTAAPTLRRTRLRPPGPETIDRWVDRAGLSERRPGTGWTPAGVMETLEGFGYRTAEVGDGGIWGVANRFAALGFLLFHLSFAVLFLGAVAIYYTRIVGNVTLVEGQDFVAEGGRADPARPFAGTPRLRFSLVSVEPVFEQGLPVHLGAVLRFSGVGKEVERRVWVNHPATVGPVSILVESAGLAPVLWLQDATGSTVDRAAGAASTLGTGPTVVPLAGGRVTVEIEPLGAVDRFPSRSELATTAVDVIVRDADEMLYQGPILPGQAVDVGDGRLVLEELRYWAGFVIVSERGGGLVVAGLALAVIGLLWRLVWHRREIVVRWSRDGFAIGGRSDFFRLRFEREMETLAETLSRDAGQ